MLIELLAIFLDSGIIPTANTSYPVSMHYISSNATLLTISYVVVCGRLYWSHCICILLSFNKRLRWIPIRRRRHSPLAMGASLHSPLFPVYTHSNPTPISVSPTIMSHHLWCFLLRRHCHLQILRRIHTNQNYGFVRRIPHLAYLLRRDIHTFPTYPRIPHFGRPMAARRHHLRYRILYDCTGASVRVQHQHMRCDQTLSRWPVLLFVVCSPECHDGL